MKFTEALELALKSAVATTRKEVVDIENTLGRVISEDIECIKDLPPYNNSAMDGYAFKYSEIKSELNVVETILAGDIIEPKLKDNDCYKIMTGAKVPSDCDTIAPREICEINNNYIKVLKDINKGNALRLKGEEQKSGTILLKKGEILTAAKIALLASQGITKVECYKELNIAIVSTGSELKEPYEEASEDELYNINGINIKMHLKSFGINSKYLGTLPDTLEKSIDFFSNLSKYDIIISSGGVSGGDADFTKKALLANGFNELFHGLAVKPGHPILMGKMKNSFVIALPGNPLAAILHTLIMAIPIIMKIKGANTLFYNTIEAKSTQLKLKPNRVNIVLGNYENGKFSAYKNNKYGSGMITPLVKSNSIAIFGENISEIKENQVIKIVLLDSNINSKSFNYIN